MNTLTSILRLITLAALTLLALLLILGEEQDPTPGAFLIHVLLDKTLGILTILTLSRLLTRWRHTDRIISSLLH